MNDRQIRFGKYKGQPIKVLIMEHIGYIMWCLENISNFELNEEEQQLYDAVAIAIVKYNIEMVFPINTMLAHVKNKEKLISKETPFLLRGDGMVRYDTNDKTNPIIASILPYFPKKNTSQKLHLSEYSREVQHFINNYDFFQGVDNDDF